MAHRRFRIKAEDLTADTLSPIILEALAHCYSNFGIIGFTQRARSFAKTCIIDYNVSGIKDLITVKVQIFTLAAGFFLQ
jgi:hypothetical protein